MQNLLAILSVVAACVYLGTRVYQMVSLPSGKSGCGNCGAARDGIKRKTLVEIDLDVPRKDNPSVDER